MNLHDQVPVLVLHVLEGDISQDTGIVNQDINAAKSLDGSLDDLLAVLDAVVIGNGIAALGLDFLDDDISGLGKQKLQG